MAARANAPRAPRSLAATSRWPWPLAALLATALALPAGPLLAAPAVCSEEQGPPLLATPEADALAQARRTLRGLLLQAQERSSAVGAARLLAEAAQAELQEAQAAPLPRVTLAGGANGVANHYGAPTRQSGLQGQINVNASAPLFDGGRSAALIDWRQRLQEAAHLGEIDAREQVALQTVSLALDQQRYRRQAEVYARYASRMGCLVSALEQIVAADRGRASELLQVRNTLRQAQLSLAQAQSQQRQVETRLRRFVGEPLPPPAPLETLLPAPPPLQSLLSEAAEASPIAQLDAQAQAQAALARATRAAALPQVSWGVSGSRQAGALAPVTAWSGGISVSVPLLDRTQEPAQRAAALRAEAAQAQRDEALSARLQRVAETHEQASAAFERARASAEVLQGSQRLREATLQQWQQLGRRSLFDVISTESDFHNLLITRVNALLDAQQATALVWSLGRGVDAALQ